MPKHDRAWVRLPSGRRLNLAQPTMFDWDDRDLAVGLSRTFRWGGHSIWPLPLSVAQHSLLVLAIHRSSNPAENTTSSDLRELLHDAEEGLVGFDPISPLKPIFGDAFNAVMLGLQTAVFARYGIQHWSDSERKRHKKADVLAAASEAVHVAGWSPVEVSSVLKIKQTPLPDDPLTKIYGGVAWEPWPSDVAAERFLTELNNLTKGN